VRVTRNTKIHSVAKCRDSQYYSWWNM